MIDSVSADRERTLRESIRKQLDDKTWPQVMSVFGYTNPLAPRVSREEYATLQEYFERMHCPSLVMFLKIVEFNEQALGQTMSFNLSLCRRLVPGKILPTAENYQIGFLTPDILVGTRRGVEGAAVWFTNLAAANLHPDSLELFDKIFEEAVVLLSGVFVPMSLAEMAERAFSDEPLPLHTKEPLKQ